MKIVCDTNVLISGVIFGGRPREILTLVSRGLIVNVTSTALLREAEDVLLRPKFGLLPEEVSGMMTLFRESFELVQPSRRVKVVSNDPDDNRVLEAAYAGGVECIVSGNDHLLCLHEWEGIRILSPSDFLENATR